MEQYCKKIIFFSLVFIAIAPARALTILPTFDNSIRTNANAAGITNAILFCIGTLQSNLTDNSTVKILFVADESVGLGQSTTWDGPYTYSNYLAALRGRASSVNDTNALSRIPNASTDPLVGNSQIQMKLPLARLMGLDSGYGSDGFDSTISCKMSSFSFTRPLDDTNKYDFIGTVEHEMNEVLGLSSNLKYGYPAGPISPLDLFRYTTNLVRTWTTNGDNAYFSVDGTNLLARFNQEADGDYHDWWSASALWAPPGQTPHVQVQDAFGTPGNTQDEGPNELAALDVIGYTLASVSPSSPPALNIVRTGLNQYTVSWPNTYSGYVLQERTNLITGGWVSSASGSANPAVLGSPEVRKFYRLFKTGNTPGPALKASAVTISATDAISTNPYLHQAVHVILPRQP